MLLFVFTQRRSELVAAGADLRAPPPLSAGDDELLLNASAQMFKDVFSSDCGSYRCVIQAESADTELADLSKTLLSCAKRSCSLSAVTCLYFYKGLHQNLLFWPSFPGDDVINTVSTAAFTDRRFLLRNIFIRSIVFISVYKKYVFHLVSNEQPEEAL